MERLRASRKSLRASRESLRASRESLRASRKSLRASRKSLRASRESLRASRESLRASRKSLRASCNPLCPCVNLSCPHPYNFRSLSSLRLFASLARHPVFCAFLPGSRAKTAKIAKGEADGEHPSLSRYSPCPLCLCVRPLLAFSPEDLTQRPQRKRTKGDPHAKPRNREGKKTDPTIHSSIPPKSFLCLPLFFAPSRAALSFLSVPSVPLCEPFFFPPRLRPLGASA